MPIEIEVGQQPDEFDLPAVPPVNVGQLLASMSQLQQDLIAEKDKRLEHSFYFIAGIAFLFSVIMAKFLESAGVTFGFVVIELLVLVGLARKLGVDWIVDPLNSALEFVKNFGAKG
jgi:hypothetical protein